LENYGLKNFVLIAITNLLGFIEDRSEITSSNSWSALFNVVDLYDGIFVDKAVKVDFGSSFSLSTGETEAEDFELVERAYVFETALRPREDILYSSMEVKAGKNLIRICRWQIS